MHLVYLLATSICLSRCRKVYRERELSFGASVRLYRTATPGDIGVAPKLFPEDPALLHGSYPYESAVQELQHLGREFCPQRKLECIGEIQARHSGLSVSSYQRPAFP